MALLLRGFDRWVVEARPTCEEATRVLRCLQRVATQAKSVQSQTILSIPVLMQREKYGRIGMRVNVSSMPSDSLLF